eukprot:GHRR01015048.1.p1 GENE.GHRR01015048.1~~GHRR01015048.1.p1  ORF type:complete len:431 (+),score=160.92 GHRR01015048.1:224-1516(+)
MPGFLKLPLPHPAHQHHIHLWPPEAPWLPKAPEASLLNALLQQHAVRLFEGQLHGVETVTVDPANGRLLLPDKWGDVYTAVLLPNGTYSLNPKAIAQLGPGRVLGNKLDADGNLVMCDVLKGLLRLNLTDHSLEQLTARVDGPAVQSTEDSSIVYANSLDIAGNGSIYFTASTDILPARARDGSYDTGFAWVLNNFRALPRGRVLAHHPHTRNTQVVASGFYYSDGIAISEDSSYLLVVETDALRVVKIWLTGQQAGKREVLIDSLPGLPAGLSKSSDGNYWVSMTIPVPPYSRHLGSVLLRALIAWSPRSWRPAVKVWGAVLKISPEGKMLQLLLDPTGARVATASAATEHNGRLFLGSIMGGPFISYIELADSEAATAAAAADSQSGRQPACSDVSVDNWHTLGGWSLHQQQDLWGDAATGRMAKQQQ